MDILNTFSHGEGWLIVMVALLAFCYAGLFLWVVKAKYFYADKLFLRLDKELKKYGMWTLLMWMTVVVVTGFVIHGAFVLLSLVTHHA